MIRWLAIFLLIMIPLQTSWAAVSAYCQHESGSASKHAGHHAHEHQVAPEPSADTPSKGFDADCSTCHIGGAAATMTQLPLTERVLVTRVHPGDPPLRLEALPAQPERPDWRLPA